MADYLKIQNFSNNGTLAISRRVFETLASEATARVQGASLSSSKKIGSFSLTKPVNVSFRSNGKVEVEVSITLKKGVAAKEVCTKIQEEIATSFNTYAESVPFDIRIKVADVQ